MSKPAKFWAARLLAPTGKLLHVMFRLKVFILLSNFGNTD